MSRFVPCVQEELKNKNITFRIKKKGPNGKNIYSHMIILVVKETKEDANAFLQSTPTGRSGRVKIPKLRKYTPQTIHSPKKSVKNQMALEKEIIEAKALRKLNAVGIAKGKKDVESRIQKLSSKTVHLFPSQNPCIMAATIQRKTEKVLPKVIQNIKCSIDYKRNIPKSTSPGLPKTPLPRTNSTTDATLVGLKNQGTTCYLNSILHILYFTNALRKAIFKIPNGSNQSAAPVTEALSRIFCKLQLGNKTVTTDDLTRNNIGGETFEFSKEQDVHEFLQLLLNKLQKEMKSTCVDDTVSKLFEGMMISIIKCKHVPVTSRKVEKFRDVQLNIFKKKNVYESFDDYVEGEVLDGNNKYKTDWHGLQVAEKTMIFDKFPHVLFLHLLRFVYNTETCCFEKYNGRFEFDEELNLKRYLRESESSGDANYRLQSVLVHSGEKNSGHYIAFIDPKCDGKWHKFNDDRVSRCTKEQAIEDNFGNDEIANTTNAYMLVYIRTSELQNVLEEVATKDIPEELQSILETEDRHAYYQSLNQYTDSTPEDMQLRRRLDHVVEIDYILRTKDHNNGHGDARFPDANTSSKKDVEDSITQNDIENCTSPKHAANVGTSSMDVEDNITENYTENGTSLENIVDAGPSAMDMEDSIRENVIGNGSSLENTVDTGTNVMNVEDGVRRNYIENDSSFENSVDESINVKNVDDGLSGNSIENCTTLELDAGTDLIHVENAVENGTSPKLEAGSNVKDVDESIGKNDAENGTGLKYATVVGTTETELDTISGSLFLKRRALKTLHESSTSQCTTYPDLRVEMKRHQWKHKLSNDKNNYTKNKKNKRNGKQKDKRKRNSDIMPKLMKMEKKIITAIKTANIKMSPIAFASNAKESFELPIDANADGKVTVLDDIVIDHESYLKAADASNMKKRVNAIVDGLWTLEERLNLTVDTKRRNMYKCISSQELNNIRKLCLHLQHHRALPLVIKSHNLLSDLKRWVSEKLKTDRYRNTDNFRTKKIGAKNCKRNKTEEKENQNVTNFSAEETSSSDNDIKVKKSRKYPRANKIVSSDSEN